MTLDEIERKARDMAKHGVSVDATTMAEMLLAVLPVVLAADRATDDEGTMPGYLCTEVVKMRKRLAITTARGGRL